jgi:phospholipid N-methyltransferase
MSKTLASYWHFLVAGLANQRATGAIVPSQKFLIRKMLAPIPGDYRGEVVELGAGTGALTVELAAKCPSARVLACEINPVLARHLEGRLQRTGLHSRVAVVTDAAENLLTGFSAGKRRQPDFIISGIPLANLPRETVMALVALIQSSLRQGGMYIQFQHSVLDRKNIRAQFRRLRTVPVLLNFPPAVVYYAQK